jgi:hypothetical protein
MTLTLEWPNILHRAYKVQKLPIKKQFHRLCFKIQSLTACSVGKAVGKNTSGSTTQHKEQFSHKGKPVTTYQNCESISPTSGNLPIDVTVHT